jgi:hypothetical protein
MIMTYVRPPGWKRLLPALAVVGGFVVGGLVGAHVTVVRETSEPVVVKVDPPRFRWR